MRLKLFLLFTLLASLPLMAQTGLQGVVIDARSGAAVPGAFIMLDDQGITVTSGPDGDFSISNAQPGKDRITVVAYGYKDWSQAVEITPNLVDFMGSIRLDPMAFNPNTNYKEASNELTINESQLEDEEGNTQSIATLNGASDNPFYQAASYDFSIMRFRMRGYNTEYTSTSINGINFNDAVRGRFNYSMTGGLNQAFRNRSTGIGLDATAYAFGDVGGANNINTYAKDFAPGFRGSVAYTNGNYKWRGMVTYSTGRMKGGWSLAFSAVARYADEGIVPGSFYKSYGYFLSAQRDFGDKHSIALTTFGAPTRRSNNSAVVQEAYDLAGTNLYNVNWGWQDGKKRSARIVQSYDPTVILNWIWKPKKTTTLNTGFAFHKSFYASTALSWYNAPDPRPDYYRYLPSYFSGDVADTYTRLWQTDESTRQINWDRMYYVNYLNNYEADQP
ncbi:MAG: carboxypeptidase regulatory-like domain-containing protein, partial [Muribaculaceae bacterium]|nr:carboxypeptidase regulatory-like domain-containing protein [Muribaculaceae bacterium]